MIKVIKLGVIPQSTPKYQTTCPNCRTIFEYEMSDVHYIPNGNNPFYYCYVECPLCKVNCSSLRTEPVTDLHEAQPASVNEKVRNHRCRINEV